MANDSKKQARLSAVQDYLDELYNDGTLLRYDLLSRKVQTSLTSSSWRDITDRDINSITREVSIRSGQNISAEAVYLVEQGFNYWFDQDDIRILEAHNEEFREQLNEEQLLSVYFDVPAADSPSARFMTTAEISDKLVTYGSIKHPMPLSTLGLTMKKAGYQAIRKGKQRVKGWLVYERSSDEIQVFRSSYNIDRV